MIIDFCGQPGTALQPAPLENPAALSCGHPCPKTVPAHAPPDLGLIGSFRHLIPLHHDNYTLCRAIIPHGFIFRNPGCAFLHEILKRGQAA